MPFAKINNLELYYEIHGQGPRLLFIPGTASDLRQHPNIFDSPLSKHFELLCFDPRGIGQSNSPDDKPTMLSYATDIKNLLDKLNWTKCHVMGESFGGMIAQEFAINFSQCVQKLVLVVTSSGGKGGASFPYHEYDISKMSLEERAAFWVQCSDKRMAISDWKEKNSDLYQQQYQTYLKVFQLGVENPERALFSARQIHARKFHDTYNRLPTLTMPTYICGGHHDKTAPIENQLNLLQQIPNARLTFFNGSHMLLWQDPFAFASIKNFLLF